MVESAMPNELLHTVVEFVLTCVCSVLAWFVKDLIKIGNVLSVLMAEGKLLRASFDQHVMDDKRQFERVEDQADMREARIRGEISSLRAGAGGMLH